MVSCEVLHSRGGGGANAAPPPPLKCGPVMYVAMTCSVPFVNVFFPGFDLSFLLPFSLTFEDRLNS